MCEIGSLKYSIWKLYLLVTDMQLFGICLTFFCLFNIFAGGKKHLPNPIPSCVSHGFSSIDKSESNVINSTTINLLEPFSLLVYECSGKELLFLNI